MSRWFWSALALSAVVVAVVLGIGGRGGLGGEKTHAGVVEGPYAYIDKDIYNGEGPCDPDFVDDSTVEKVGSTHKLAVCIGGLSQAVGAFELHIRYDDELDKCLDEDCSDGLCLDDNPDANVGVTTWGGGLGAGWDCEIEEKTPICDRDDDSGPQEGLASIGCEGPADGVPYTTGDGESQTVVDDDGAWATLAVLTLDVAAAGTDEVIIDYLRVWAEPFDSVLIGECGFDGNGVFYEAAIFDEEMPCYGATDIKRRPPNHKKTPTPTVTATEVVPTPTSPPPATPPPAPTATATPFGGPGGIVIAPPETGSGRSGGGFPWTLTASLLAGSAGAAMAAGGLYLRLAKGSRGEGKR